MQTEFAEDDELLGGRGPILTMFLFGGLGILFVSGSSGAGAFVTGTSGVGVSFGFALFAAGSSGVSASSAFLGFKTTPGGGCAVDDPLKLVTARASAGRGFKITVFCPAGTFPSVSLVSGSGGGKGGGGNGGFPYVSLVRESGGAESCTGGPGTTGGNGGNGSPVVGGIIAGIPGGSWRKPFYDPWDLWWGWNCTGWPTFRCRANFWSPPW
jgi:hypothetical protein